MEGFLLLKEFEEFPLLTEFLLFGTVKTTETFRTIETKKAVSITNHLVMRRILDRSRYGNSGGNEKIIEKQDMF